MIGRALLASPLGLLIGVSLGALGGGGSILAVPVLVFVVGQSPAAATTTSLLVVGTAAVAGAARHHRRGRVRLGPGLAFGAVGIGGSIIGSSANRRIDGDALLLAFSVLVLVAAWRIVVGCPSCTQAGGRRALVAGAPRPDASGGVRIATALRPAHAVHFAGVLAAGTFVGFLTGLFGVGGGFVIVPVLALVLRYPMPEAIGTSLVVIAVNSVVALGARLGGGIEWSIAVPFALAAIAGVGVGGRVADRISPTAMQQGFAVLLVLVALYTAARASVGLW